MNLDPSRPLHPNLARVAAAYDDICGRWAAGLLTAEAANVEIAALAARDDEGVVWSIDPATGAWQYRTFDGRLVPGTPPTSGYATPTAYDVSRNPDRPNPADQVVFFAADDADAPDSLVGATRRPGPVVVEPAAGRRWLLWTVVAVVAVIAVVALFR